MFHELADIGTHGVKIRIVQNQPNYEFPDLDSLALAEMGAAEVRNLSIEALLGSGVLHTKLWVVDQKHFYMGSANMDWRALTQVCIPFQNGILVDFVFSMHHPSPRPAMGTHYISQNLPSR